jgi:hypothetical protein
MLLNQVELDCFAIHHHFDHAAAVERPPALGDVHAADDIFDSGWIFQGVAGALDLADVAGVECELAQTAVGLDEMHGYEVRACGLDEAADAVAGAPASRDGGGVGHWTGARGLTVWLFLLSTTISHSCAFGAAIYKNPFMTWQKTHSGGG